MILAHESTKTITARVITLFIVYSSNGTEIDLVHL